MLAWLDSYMMLIVADDILDGFDCDQTNMVINYNLPLIMD